MVLVFLILSLVSSVTIPVVTCTWLLSLKLLSVFISSRPSAVLHKVGIFIGNMTVSVTRVCDWM